MAARRVQRNAQAQGEPVIPTLSGRLVARWVGICFSYWTTYLLVESLNGVNWGSVGIALALEIVMFKGKALLWERSKSDIWGLACLVLDTTTNAGGLWPATTKLASSNTWAMWAAALNLETEVRALPALVIALAGGFILAVLPFALREDDK